jgi:hypothetical protein
MTGSRRSAFISRGSMILPSFDAFARKALGACGKPVVALKVGRSDQARAATVSHTASIAQAASAGASALFEQARDRRGAVSSGASWKRSSCFTCTVRWQDLRGSRRSPVPAAKPASWRISALTHGVSFSGPHRQTQVRRPEQKRWARKWRSPTRSTTTPISGATSDAMAATFARP